ncbi:hypothetical protein BC826DRAFT_1108402 [Russula brevipes]|nr:hypothetical protein BC826DRAFT_1108402 [Russula brevipes]
MTLRQNSISLPNVSISSKSSFSPNDNTISTEQPTPSICNGFKLNLADECPHPTVASSYAPHPINALPDPAVPGTVSPSTYLQWHATSTATSLTDSVNPPHLRALPSHQCYISLSRSHSASDIRSVAVQPSSQDLFSIATEARYQQQRRNSYHGVTTDFPSPSLNPELVSAAPSQSSADSVTSSGWVYRRAEESQGVRYAIPTSDLPPITAGDQGASPVVQYPPTSSNPFSDITTDVWATPSGSISTPSHTAQEYSVNERSSENVRDDREHAQRMADSCKEDAKGVLILSGVLSAIVTAFLIEGYKMLPPADLGDGPPAASIVWVNIMWLMSLVLSITSTLFATLALQWARRLTQLHRILNTDTSRDRTHIPLFACCGTLRYNVHRAVSMIVVFLHLSVFLFLVGLVVFFFTINKLVAIVVSMVVGLFGMIYFTITILACVDRDCPYHTPMSGAWWPNESKVGGSWDY